MTEENYKYRTSPFLLRNQFTGKGKLQIPIIPKFQVQEGDFDQLRLIGFDKTKLENTNHLDRMVHFFLYDYKFERVWKNPDADLEKLKRYRAVLSPDFSMYVEMAPVLQLYNTFRNRWCGAYFASKGIRVVPTVNWGNENTFEFCFDGVEKGSTVAVSTYMVSEHDNRQDQKEFFLKGYNEMLKRIEPEKIICYNEPFPEMRGDIVFVDYELSSWRYLNDDPYVPSKYAEYICGAEPLPAGSDLIIKQGHVLSRYEECYNRIQTGMGSAYGGKWKPAKTEDKRFLGNPGEIKTTLKNGYRVDTKIGENGKATKERHYTDHNRPWAHTNPHDHDIGWDVNRGNPLPGPPINYPKEDYPKGAPEFKSFKEMNILNTIVQANSLEENRFKTINDFKWCVDDGGEVEFIWNGITYNITHPEGIISISEANKRETEKSYGTADEVLEYRVGKDRLRDVITQVTVTDRTI